LLYLIAGGAKVIKFLDRTFNINRNYAMEMFQFLIDNHQGCVFQFEITADIMRPEVLDFLAQNAPPGVFRFEIGVQSTNDETNELVKRRQNFTKLSRTVMKIKASGNIDQHLDLIAGLPMEDYSTFRKTFNDVFAMEPEELQLGFPQNAARHRAARPGGQIRLYVHGACAVRNSQQPCDALLRHYPTEAAGGCAGEVLEQPPAGSLGQVSDPPCVSVAVRFLPGIRRLLGSAGLAEDRHQLEDLFIRLQDFLTDRGTGSMDIITGLMKLDYFLGTSTSRAKSGGRMCSISRSGRST
jgi:anaerobic magnesium-protoporphyrin IX monomethyl ester cyclase